MTFLETIRLAHGGGGLATGQLISSVFGPHFSGIGLQPGNDAALLDLDAQTSIAFTTDGFVVDPPFFRGSSLGELAVVGTCNDLAVMGAKPRWLTCGFILGTGTEVKVVDQVAADMERAAREQGVSIVAGDTKVIEHQRPPHILVTTAGLGVIQAEPAWQVERVRVGDILIISGSIGEHALAVMAARNGWDCAVASDCASLYLLLKRLHGDQAVHWVRDVSRGGLAGILNELAEAGKWEVEIAEEAVPVDAEVASWCEILGYDPFELANEGKALLAVAPEGVDRVLQELRSHPLGKKAAVIGSVKGAGTVPTVVAKTAVGGRRFLPAPSGELLPRIC